MSDVFTKLSSSLISNDFIESIIAAIATTNDDKLLFLSLKALENGFYDDPLIIQNELLRELLKEVSSLRSEGADIVSIKEKIAPNMDRYKVLVDILDRRLSAVTNDLFLNDIFVEKIRNQVVVKHLQGIANLLNNVTEKTKTTKLLASLEETLTRMLTEMNINLDFREMTLKEIQKRIETRRKRGLIESKVRVPTGINLLDDVLKGGIEKGRLVVLASSPGYGKSMVCVNCAVEAVRKGFNAWVITLENSLIETWARLDANITNIEIDNLDTMSKTVDERVTKFAKDPNHGELLVKEFPPDALTITILKNYMVQKISQGFKRPDIIFIDYLDIVKSEKSYAQVRFELAHITKSMKRLASDFDCVVISPTQLNRDAMSEDDSKGGMSNLAEAFSKAFEPDLLLVVRQSKREIQHDRFRIFIAKSRISKSRMEVLCEVNYEKMKVRGLKLQYPGDSDIDMLDDDQEFALTSMEQMLDGMENGNNK